MVKSFDQLSLPHAVGNEAEEDIVVTRLIDRPTKGHIYVGETKDGLRPVSYTHLTLPTKA